MRSWNQNQPGDKNIICGIILQKRAFNGGCVTFQILTISVVCHYFLVLHLKHVALGQCRFQTKPENVIECLHPTFCTCGFSKMPVSLPELCIFRLTQNRHNLCLSTSVIGYLSFFPCSPKRCLRQIHNLRMQKRSHSVPSFHPSILPSFHPSSLQRHSKNRRNNISGGTCQQTKSCKSCTSSS